MLDYAWDQIRNFALQTYHSSASILIGSGLWQLIQNQFGGMFITNAFFWLPTLWLMSWLCGGLWAIKEGRWSRSKAAHSVWKLIGYMAILVVAHAFRHFSVVGGYPASIIEVACIFIEGYNALENAAGLTDIAWLKKLIGFSKNKIQDQLSRMVGMVSEIKDQHEQMATQIAEVKAVTETLAIAQENSTGTLSSAAQSSENQNQGKNLGNGPIAAPQA